MILILFNLKKKNYSRKALQINCLGEKLIYHLRFYSHKNCGSPRGWCHCRNPLQPKEPQLLYETPPAPDELLRRREKNYQIVKLKARHIPSSNSIKTPLLVYRCTYIQKKTKP